MNTLKKVAIVATLGLATFAPPAFAQNDVDGLATETTHTTTVEKEDNDFPWGLLGLLGLAGLLPRKRKEADIHVDARRDNRP
jgi:hypothetical protein